MKGYFETNRIQHIIVDEAQNFHTEDGNWCEKAKGITQGGKACPRMFWIFLDYFQTSHLKESGLPDFELQYPKEELTQVVRNGDKIAEFLQQELGKIRDNPPCSIPRASLNIVHEFKWSQSISGTLKIKYLTSEKMVSYVANKCDVFLSKGYSPQDIAVLFSTDREKKAYEHMFLREMRKKRRASQMNDTSVCHSNMFDRIRRFSGLERSIVFGINPIATEQPISHNLLICLASRAMKYLYILYALTPEGQSSTVAC
uniref:Slfn8 protein n=1 Tax=Mus musculus TaxID=10090 RepID=Q8R3R7_MOUSE|nr:Slfn8 protein [Mus musculus]